MLNCTLSGNSASHGSTIANYKTTIGPPPTVTIVHCTLVGSVQNEGADGSGAARIDIGSTILDGALTNVAGAVVISNGWNMTSSNGAGLFTGPGDQINTDPKLDPAGLLNNGGPTRTIALTSGSPALDAGKNFGVGIDQRGSRAPMTIPQLRMRRAVTARISVRMKLAPIRFRAAFRRMWSRR